MTKAGERIIRGAKQALEYARNRPNLDEIRARLEAATGKGEFFPVFQGGELRSIEGTQLFPETQEKKDLKTLLTLVDEQAVEIERLRAALEKRG